jgi:large-conductance mechanosensitive channel
MVSYSSVIIFIIIAAVVFLLIVRPIAQMVARQKTKEPAVTAAVMEKLNYTNSVNEMLCIISFHQ